MENVERILGISSFGAAIKRLLNRSIQLAAIIALGVMIGYVSSMEFYHMKLIEVSILMMSILISIHFYSKRPHLLLSYTLFTWVISPEIRRLLDWSFQSYSNTSIVSLVPYCVSLTLLLPIIKNFKHIERHISLILKIIGAALIYGFCIGFLKFGFSSLFDLLNYIVPFLVLVYVHVSGFDSDVRDKWLRHFSAFAVLAAAYGIYQYIAFPPWDEFWMIHAEMNSIGLPEPQRFRVFSVLNSPGPAGVFLGLSLAVMTVQKKWRAFGIIGVMIVAFALLLTLVRVGWIAYVVMLIAYFVRTHLRSKVKLFMLCGVIIMAYLFVLPVLPGADNVVSRLDTFGSLEDDHSFNERLSFSSTVVAMLKANPIGMGLGSSGLGAKLTQNSDALVAFDNGYLNIFYTFGLPLGLGIIATLCYLFFSLFKLSKVEKAYAPISLAAICAVLFLLFASNILRGLSGFILLFVISLAYLPKSSNREES